ncbi:hypothetical protein QQS21_007308 [Conoideocrella luteorostrata]|uniref:Meiotic expression up-regulated protein 6 PH domain-containing protein n=1 Tax=Conoideocrella luteorostrata TaxID=1105319 RepID=A0AAJ0FS75_9HYPO|nr:hypothetical protein QQS21_007308 [Conoideocrella luteorostrata]
MAEVQKPVVELPKEEVAPVTAVEPTATEIVAAPGLAVEPKPTEEPKTTDETEAKTEDKTVDEVKPVEEGHLSHKAQGASFPKNLIASKEFLFFGSDSFEPKALAAYLRGEKNTEHAHHNISWASHTGNGLLFVGDKKAPSNIINLADTTEPETDGTNKFHFTHKGAKHSFKAASSTERDSWVAQLKAKITEAKELATSVTESEAYKSALLSLKPTVKEEKPAEETKAEETAKTEDTPAVEGETAAAVVAEDKAAEEPKRRSASRKRASIFGFGKKESTKEKKEESKTEEAPAADVAAVVPAAEPATDALKAEEAPVAAVGTEASVTAEDKAPEEEQALESPKEKPTASKRNSFFGGVFSKKEKKSTDVKPTEEGETTTDAVAPVIPPVESTTPLNAEEVNAAAENTETSPAAVTETAPKKDVKEKRKSSLPFAFGRREKSPAPAEGEEKRQNQGAFSKLRATIKGKSAAKADEKPAEEAVKEETAATDSAVATEEPAVAEPVKATEAETENKPENVASVTPAVTAAA